jgi:hypothetical protein
MISLNLNYAAFLLVCFSFAFNGNCEAQKMAADSCKNHFITARKKLGLYYKTRDNTVLPEAIKTIELSLQCPETRRAAVELKLSLLSLQKQYRNAYYFVNTLSESDFKYSYRKKMNYDFFRALEYESKPDTLKRNVYLNKARAAIEKYIGEQSTHDDKSDMEPYYDLIFIMKKMGSQQRLNTEIDRLKKKYPGTTNMLNALNEGVTSSGRSTKTTYAQ